MGNKNTKELFDELADKGIWPSRYGELNQKNYNFFTRRESVHRLLRNDKFTKALDIGCGSGDYAEVLSTSVDEYIGVDFSPKMIQKARELHSNNKFKTEFIEGDGADLKFEDNTFDLITAIGYIEYFIDPNEPLKEMTRVLKPGGTIIIQSYQIDLFGQIYNMSGLPFLRTIFKFIYIPLSGKELKRTKTIVDLPYKKDKLDELMLNHGCKISSYEYNNFCILPKCLRKLIPKLYIASSEKITQSYAEKCSIFAVNYNGRYKKSDG